MESNPPNNNSNTKALPLWIKIGSFLALLVFLVLMAIALSNSSFKTLRVGDEVPDFTLTTFEGQAIRLSDLQGKTVLINFWASWCMECKDEAAMLQAVWQEVEPAGSVVFLGVDYADTRTEALSFIQENLITYANGADLRSTISRLFHTTGVPETYVIDKKGILSGVNIGPFSSIDEIRALLEQ